MARLVRAFIVVTTSLLACSPAPPSPYDDAACSAALAGPQRVGVRAPRPRGGGGWREPRALGLAIVCDHFRDALSDDEKGGHARRHAAASAASTTPRSTSSTGSLYAWELERGRRSWRVPVRGGIVVNDGLVCTSLAEEGLGLAYAVEPLVEEQIRAGG